MPLRIRDRTVCLMMLAVALVGGCGDRSDRGMPTSDVRPASYRDRAADEFLDAVFTRYRNSASYHDEASVRISYDNDGRWETVTQPLSVWFDQDQLYVQAYNASLWSSRQSVSAWVNDPETADLDSQVLQGPAIEGRPRLEPLLSDEILVELLGSGLAGPPPQLEWLFAAEPMQRLFDSGHHFNFGPDRVIDGCPCLSVAVDAAGKPFRFWIDRSLGLIRRVDLPPVVSLAADDSPGEIKLSLDLNGASFDTPQSGPSFAPLPAGAKYVRRFVPLPPIPPPDVLGTRAARFRLTSSNESLTLTEVGADRPVTVLLLYASDASSTAAAGMLQHWAGMMTPSLSGRVRVLIVADQSAVNFVPGHFALPIVIDPGGKVAAAYRIQPGSVVVLRPGGEVGWVQPELNSESLVQLGAIVGDVLEGIDVPQRVRDQWQAATADYQTKLRQQRIPSN